MMFYYIQFYFIHFCSIMFSFSILLVFALFCSIVMPWYIIFCWLNPILQLAYMLAYSLLFNSNQSFFSVLFCSLFILWHVVLVYSVLFDFILSCSVKFFFSVWFFTYSALYSCLGLFCCILSCNSILYYGLFTSVQIHSVLFIYILLTLTLYHVDLYGSSLFISILFYIFTLCFSFLLCFGSILLYIMSWIIHFYSIDSVITVVYWPLHFCSILFCYILLTFIFIFFCHVQLFYSFYAFMFMLCSIMFFKSILFILILLYSGVLFWSNIFYPLYWSDLYLHYCGWITFFKQ